jgi:hypothetical protein
LKSFNYTPYLFSKKVENTALYRDNFFIVSGLCTAPCHLAQISLRKGAREHVLHL